MPSFKLKQEDKFDDPNVSSSFFNYDPIDVILIVDKNIVIPIDDPLIKVDNFIKPCINVNYNNLIKQ